MTQNYEPWDNLRGVINANFHIHPSLIEEFVEVIVDEYLGWGDYDPNRSYASILYDRLIPNISTHIDPVFMRSVDDLLYQAFQTDYRMGSRYDDIIFDPE
jgi:hypothetical protein